MDQVFEDCMTGLAEADQRASMEGMVGWKAGRRNGRNLWENLYKVRPFGVQVGNMRGLNPSGKPSSKTKNKNKNLLHCPDADKPISLNTLLADLQTAFFRC